MSQSTELDAGKIKNNLQCGLIGTQVIVLDQSGSTNDFVKAKSEQGADEGLIVIADRQTAGRGRFGRSWFSEPGVGIYLSVLLKPAIKPEQLPGLTLMAGVATVSAINEFSRVKATLKWPNDVLMNGKKLCGILCETCRVPTGENNKECHPEQSEGSFTGSQKEILRSFKLLRMTTNHFLNRLRSLFGLLQTAPTECGGVVVGIGINVNHHPSQFQADLKPIATSINAENGAPVDRTALILSLIHHLDREYASYQDGGCQAIIPKWSSMTDMFGKSVTVTRGKTATRGTALRLEASGNLVVRTDDGRELSFDSGEVTLG
ncbi:MAG: biotin--[acetyl-CoA-carboxylase] ligase [Nitrospinaceae bacterium]